MRKLGRRVTIILLVVALIFSSLIAPSVAAFENGDAIFEDTYVFSPEELYTHSYADEGEHTTYIEEIYGFTAAPNFDAFAHFFDPIFVSNLSEFISALNNPTANRLIELTADINLGAWTPINLTGAAAEFILEGNGHILTFSVNSHGGPAGLLGTISNGNVVIQNLGVNIDCSIMRHGTAYRGAEQMIAGAFIGRVSAGAVRIERSFVRGGEIYARRNQANSHGDAFAGGFIGVIQDGAYVLINDSFVNSSIRAFSRAGGAFGTNLPRAVAGGFVGMLWGGSTLVVTNSYAAGLVNAQSSTASLMPIPNALRSVGGILGAIWGPTDNALGANIVRANNVSHSGDLIGIRNTTNWGTALSEAQLRNRSTAPLNNWDWVNTWEHVPDANNRLPVLRAFSWELRLAGLTGLSPAFVAIYSGWPGQYHQSVAVLAANLLVNSNEAYWSLRGIEDFSYRHDRIFGEQFIRFGRKAMPNNTYAIIVSLRGTENNLIEWMGNLNIGFLDCSDHHRQFYVGMNSAFDYLLDYLAYFDKELTDNNIRFLVTGSSRGGAIANLLADRMMREGVAYHQLFNYNFSTPNVAIRRDWPARPNMFTIRNSNDIATLIPFNGAMTLMRPGYGWGVFGRSLWFSGSHVPLQGLDGHYIWYYRNWVTNNPLPWGQPNFLADFWARITTFKCPVDVHVYNSDGVRLASIVDNELTYFSADALMLQIFIFDDEKHVVFLDDEQYELRIIGTDEGVLYYSVVLVEIIEQLVPVDGYFAEIESFVNVSDEISFSGVRLYDGRQMVSAVGGDIEVYEVRLFFYLDDTVAGEFLEDGSEQIFEDEEEPKADEEPGAEAGNNAQHPPAPPNDTPHSTSNLGSESDSETAAESESATAAAAVTQPVVPVAQPFPFMDISTAAWYYSFVRNVWEQQLFQGVTDFSFNPQGNMTRAMFVQVLANLEGVDVEAYSGQTQTFGDVSQTAWYFGAVEWAAQHELTQGVGGGNFAPDRPITREELVVLLSNFAAHRDINFPQGETSSFSDLQYISPWAIYEVMAIQSAEIILGHPDGRFAPRDNATRAEAAAIFSRFLQIKNP